MWKPFILLVLATPFLGACERYTEQTSPCFGRDGEPVVSRAAYSPIIALVSKAVAPATAITAGKAIAPGNTGVAATDCTFEDLPRPA